MAHLISASCERIFMTILVRFGLLVLIGSAALATPVKEVPAVLDPMKAYVTVEIRNWNEAALPGTVTLAPYDSTSRDLHPEPTWEIIDRNAIAKAKKSRLYLVVLEPGEWVVQASNGTTFSRGTWSFKAQAGQVIDLGVMSTGIRWPGGKGPPAFNVGRALVDAVAGPRPHGGLPPSSISFRPRSEADLPLPPNLAGASKAELRNGLRFTARSGALENAVD
jgi:hypothetical protein